MMEFVAVVGFVLAHEGALSAIATGQLQRMMAQMQSLPRDTLRLFGVVALASGVGLVWLVRGG